ncbi:MAG: hypothetical protein AB8F34_00725 [Akkermansiaceae bacterium]
MAVAKKTLIISLLGICLTEVAFSDDLFTQRGSDKTFEEVMKSRKLPKGSNSRKGVTGSKINVDNKLVEITPEAKQSIERSIKIHTLGNSSIPRSDFKKWSRWYQEDGSTQVFRLFKGETNVRNARENAARIEAFSNLSWKRGSWHEWSGTYTIIKPHRAAILQVKNNINDWGVMLNMNEDGDIKMNHRQGKDKEIARRMVGKPFHIRVRDNGHDYEVYLDGKKVGEGSYARPKGTTSFRWGMYLGNKPVTSDAMIFVSGATVDGKGSR